MSNDDRREAVRRSLKAPCNVDCGRREQLEDRIEELEAQVKSCQAANGRQYKMIQELEEELKKHQWQPIETAPKDGGYIILAWPSESMIAKWLDNATWQGWSVPSLILKPAGNPTHWMPLPEPPENQHE